MKIKLTKVMIKKIARTKRLKLLNTRNYKKLTELSSKILSSGKADFLGYDNTERSANLKILLRGNKNKLHYKNFSKRMRIVKKQLKNDKFNLQWRLERTKGYRRSKRIDPELAPEEIVKAMTFVETDEDFYLANRDMIIAYNKDYKKLKKDNPNFGHEDIVKNISHKNRNNLLEAYKLKGKKEDAVFFKQHEHLSNKNAKNKK